MPDRSDQEAFLRLPGDQGWSAVTSKDKPLPMIKPEASLDLFSGGMTFIASIYEDWSDAFSKKLS